MKFALLILLISTSLSFQSEAVVDRFVITGKIYCLIPGIKDAVKALELWERDGNWPFHPMVDDHLKANATFNEVKEGIIEFTVEGEDDGDGYDLFGGTDYELYVRVLSNCFEDGKPNWTDFDVKDRDKFGYPTRPDKEGTRHYEKQAFFLKRRPYKIIKWWNKRSVSGHDDNQH
ncbi:unnamed protein product [Caenorhabditis nigoni]